MNNQTSIELNIQGMTCPTCASHVQNALANVPGVQSANVPSWQASRAQLSVDEGISEAELVRAVEVAGYQAVVQASPQQAQETRLPTGSKKHDYDLLVIGAGSAGFAAAIRGAELGYRVGLVGDGALGGTCVNIGCLPSKTLIRAAEAWHLAGRHAFNGIATQQAGLDWQAIRQQKDELVESMRQTKYSDVLSAYPAITYLEGRAAFNANGALEVGGQVLTASKFVIATGARPRLVPFPGFDGAQPLTSTTLMDLPDLPKSLIILGGRAIALELGQMMARLGVEVLILQRSTRLLPDHEPEIGRGIKDYFEQEGIGVITGVEVQSLGRRGRLRTVKVKVMGQEKQFEAEQILMALGREANTQAMGLENVGVNLAGNGAIQVDEWMQTSNPDIFAAGDVTNYPEYVYVAASGGSKAAENALTGTAKPLSLSALPGVIFASPQIATVGLTESEARQQGYPVKVSMLDLTHVARAQAARDTRGFIKLIADEATNRLLGAHILAAEAGEVIQSATLAIKFGITVAGLTDTLFPYLTQVEGLKLAALGFDKDVAMLSCCAG